MQCHIQQIKMTDLCYHFKIGTHCDQPLLPDPDSNLKIINWDGDSVSIGSVIICSFIFLEVIKPLILLIR